MKRSMTLKHVMAVLFVVIVMLSNCKSIPDNSPAVKTNIRLQGRDSYYRHELLPEDVTMVVSVIDMGLLLEALADSPLGRLYNGDEFQRFLDDTQLLSYVTKSFYRTYIGDGSRIGETGKMLLQQFLLFKGEVLIGVASGEGMTATEKNFILLRMTPEDFQTYISLEEALIRNKQNDERFTHYLYEGTEVYYREKDGEPVPNAIYYAHCGNTMFESNDRFWVEAVISSISFARAIEPEGIPCMDITITRATFENVYRSLDRMQQIPSESQENDVNKANVESLFAFLGFDSIEEISFRLIPETNAIIVEGNLIGAPEDGRGIFSLFNGELVKDERRLSFVPSAAYSYQEMLLNADDFWYELLLFFESFGNEEYMQLTSGLTMAETMLGVEIYADLIEPLGMTVSSYGIEEDGIQKSVLAWELDDPQTMSRTVDTIFSEQSLLRKTMKDTIRIEDFIGHTLYILDFTQNDEEKTAAGQKQIFALGIIDGNIYFGDIDCIKNTIQVKNAGTYMATTADISYYDTDLYLKMLSETPGNNLISYGVIDCNIYIKSVIDALISYIESQKQMSDMYRKLMENMEDVDEEYREFLVNEAERNDFYFDKDQLPATDYFSRFLNRLVFSITREHDTYKLLITMYDETM
ncbi:MAG: hypothetical protein JW881_20935 [Spirochaetales bacterium]|nr:hypothetical protein [Spirochaetales bacterium]